MVLLSTRDFTQIPPSYEIFDHVDQKHSRLRMSTGDRYEAGLDRLVGL